MIHVSLLLLALSAEPVEEAKALFEIGADAYENANYILAVDAFGQAYSLAPRPAVAFSLAQAYRMVYSVENNPEYLLRAVDYYSKYVDEVRSGGRREDAARHLFNVRLILVREHGIQATTGARPAPAKPKTQLAISSRTKNARGSIDGGPFAELPFSKEVTPGTHKVRVEAPGHYPEDLETLAVEGSLVAVPVGMRAMPATLQIRADSGAEISIDGRPVGEAPLDQKIPVEAGDRFLAITKRGAHPYIRELSLGRGESVELEVDLEATDQRRFAHAAFVSAGLFAAAGAGCAVYAAIADGRAAELDELRDQRGYLDAGEATRLNKRLNQRDDFRLAGGTLFGGTVLAGIAGAMLYFFDSPRIQAPTKRPASDPSVAPVIGPDTVGASVGGTF